MKVNNNAIMIVLMSITVAIMANIPVSVFAQVDDDDLALVSAHKWTHSGHGYATTMIEGRKVYLHRLVMGAAEGETIDHINQNKMDCRKANLRRVTIAQNLANAGKRKTKITSLTTDGSHRIPQSPYKGVSWRQGHQLWGASYRGKHIGLFASDLDAAVAYDARVREVGVHTAWLNFPDGVPVSAASTVIPRVASAVAGSKSQYRGVGWNDARKRWASTLRVNSKNLYFGLFESERDAALVRDAAARLAFGDMATLNFPAEAIEPPFLVAEKVRRAKEGEV